MREKEKNKKDKLDHVFIKLSPPPPSKLIREVKYIYKNFKYIKVSRFGVQLG